MSCPHNNVSGLGFVGQRGFAAVVDADPSVAGLTGQSVLGTCADCEATLARVRLQDVRGARQWEGVAVLALAPGGGS